MGFPLVCDSTSSNCTVVVSLYSGFKLVNMGKLISFYILINKDILLYLELAVLDNILQICLVSFKIIDKHPNEYG